MTNNKDFRVTLFHCGNINMANPKDDAQKNIFYMPMGVFALADILHKNGIHVEIVHSDLEAGKPIHEVIDLNKIDMIGFDLHWVNQALAVIQTAALVKSLNPDIFVVLGGFSASLFAEEIIRDFRQVDGVIKGDGEKPILQLAKTLMNNKLQRQPVDHALDQVPNLVWRDHQNIQTNNRECFIMTSDEFNSLSYDTVQYLRNWECYQLASLCWTGFETLADSPMFLMEAGRGCEYNCTFCGGNAVAQKRIGNRTRTVFRSVDTVLDSIKKTNRLGFGTYYTCIESETSEHWYLELFQRIRTAELKINWVYGCWGVPSQALVEALSDSFQNVLIEISPETSSHELRKNNKDRRLFYTNEELEKCLSLIAAKRNIKVQLCFGFYLYGDTEVTIFETMEYILELLLKFPGVIEVEYGNFSTDPGSLFFFNPDKYNLEMKTRNFKDYLFYINKNYVECVDPAADMTLFKSVSISDAAHKNILNKHKLLNYLFYYYRLTVSYILRNTNDISLVMGFIKETELDHYFDKNIVMNNLKDKLLKYSRERDIYNSSLERLINLEYSENKKAGRFSKPTTQLFLDFENLNKIMPYIIEDRLFDDSDLDFAFNTEKEPMR